MRPFLKLHDQGLSLNVLFNKCNHIRYADVAEIIHKKIIALNPLKNASNGELYNINDKVDVFMSLSDK